MQDALPVAAPVGRAPYLGVQQVGEAERVHHDQRLWGGGAAGWALGGWALRSRSPSAGAPRCPRAASPCSTPSPSAEGTACAEGQPTCTTPMAITHVQNRKMPRGAAGKATIRENCGQEIREPGSPGPRAAAPWAGLGRQGWGGLGASPLESKRRECFPL